MPAELRYVLDDREALAREHAQNLRFGRALVPRICGFEQLDPVTLVIERKWDGGTIAVDAKVVMILAAGPMMGTALEIDVGGDVRERLEAFVTAEDPPLRASSVASTPDELPTLGDDEDVLSAAPADDVEPGGDEGAPDEESDAEQRDESSDSGIHVDPKIVRIRKLSLVERMKLAREGHLEDRVLLERAFGKVVWEDLLRNPAITLPEVARIANKGTAPRVMLDQIVEHSAWSRQSIVRRALLGNPRLGADSVAKLLRATPKAELKLIGAGSAFPIGVRTLAKKLAAED